MLEELLKFANKHATVVIAALVAIVVTGSISGGLWIQNLQSALEQRDKIHDQRVQQLTESHAQELSEKIRDLVRSHEANTVLSAQFKIVEEKAGQLALVNDRLTKAIEGLNTKIPRARADALAEVQRADQEMSTTVAATTRALERAHDTSVVIAALNYTHPTPAPSVDFNNDEILERDNSRGRNLTIFLGVALLFAILIFNYFYATKGWGRKGKS